MNTEHYRKKTLVWLLIFVVSWIAIILAINILQICVNLSTKNGLIISILILAIYFIPMTFMVGCHARQASMRKLSIFMLLLRVMCFIVFVVFSAAVFFI